MTIARRDYLKRWRRQNVVKTRAYRKKWYDTHPEQAAEMCAKYYAENCEAVKRKRRVRYRKAKLLALKSPANNPQTD